MSFIPKIYTTESVTSGHPDKVCDQISDAILDACLAQDAQSRVAVECFGSSGLLVIGGEVSTKACVDYAAIGRAVYREIGYEDALRVIVNVVQQSSDIAQGVDMGGAGDQGVMYGYATDETPEFLPRGIVLAHALARGLEELRRSGEIPWLGPDGKSQVTMNNERIATVVVSAQHNAGLDYETVRQNIVHKLIIPIMHTYSRKWDEPLNYPINMYVNPAGSFVKGGFSADSGLTGRKIMVDTYGGFLPHGGGAFSGKDATKVDRSAAYMCRYVAKNLVARGLAKEALVSVAYAIGRAEPLMVQAVDENGREINLANQEQFMPAKIIEKLGLRKPIFQQTAAYGHFGKDGLPWEKLSTNQ